jgi:glutathione synthase/RimK-type ligase-like ATP-grasp enzyme
MKIAIHSSKNSFSDRWIAYCDSTGIDYKIVDCYSNIIIEEISDCDALMWHFHHNNPRATLFAKQLLHSIEKSGIRVFPDLNTVWHFDDKIGQKYLLESIDAPLVPTWIFYKKSEALKWVHKCEYPVVFKLRGGAGSQNVRLVRNKKEALRLVRKAFGRGFALYDPVRSLQERWRLFLLKKTPFRDLLKGFARFIVPPPYSRAKGREKGYVYFQQYIPSNDHDIRVVVIGDKAFAIKRMVRENDFRASGSGNILYDRHLFCENLVRLAFDIAMRLKSQSLAMDFVYDGDKPLLLEISYCFASEGYDPCPGYWTKDLIWHDGKVSPCAWMVDQLSCKQLA